MNGVQVVVGSNPTTPTSDVKDLFLTASKEDNRKWGAEMLP